MGYHTEFSGSVAIAPPLNQDEIEFLQKFSATRRMARRNGPYFVDGSGEFGQGQDPDITNFNEPPAGQPGLWCQWTPSDDGSAIEWDGGEKFYNAPEWMSYLIEHFLKPNASAPLAFLQKNHVVSGVIEAEGEDYGDRWCLHVERNKVRVAS